jgi:hypothetical protein
MHETLIAKDIAKILPNVNHSFIHASATLLTTPPIVFATSQKRQPPEIQAGCDCSLRKGFLGGHIHGCLLLWVVKNLLLLRKYKAKRHGASFYTVLF